MVQPENAKLFVGALAPATTEADLREHFSAYGVVESAVVLRSPVTGAPRCFGFVTFADAAAADVAMLGTGEKHVIMGKMVEVKKAFPRHQSGQSSSQITFNGITVQSSTKIFVGGLPPNLTEREFRNFFARFGAITDAVVMMESATQRPRGFGFVTFASAEAVDNVLRRSFYELNGKTIEVKRAVPKDHQAGANGNGWAGNGASTSSVNHQGMFYPPSPNFGPCVYAAPPPTCSNHNYYMTFGNTYMPGFPLVDSGNPYMYQQFLPGYANPCMSVPNGFHCGNGNMFNGMVVSNGVYNGNGSIAHDNGTSTNTRRNNGMALSNGFYNGNGSIAYDNGTSSNTRQNNGMALSNGFYNGNGSIANDNGTYNNTTQNNGMAVSNGFYNGNASIANDIGTSNNARQSNGSSNDRAKKRRSS